MATEELILRGGVTLFATFAGAFTAYLLQNRRESDKEKKRRINALNTALFTLLRQVNALASFKKDLEPLENDPSRCFKVKPWKPNKYDDVKINFESLSFILETEDPNILHHLLIEQERFEQALKTIILRSEFQVNTIQPLLESGDIGGKRRPYEEVESIIGKYKLDGLVLATDNVYEHVYKTYSSSLEYSKELHSFAKKQYPNVKFISIDNET